VNSASLRRHRGVNCCDHARMRILSFSVVIALLVSPSTNANELIPGVSVIRGAFAPGSQPDGNSVILDAPDGLIVVDTGRHVTHTQAIVDFAKRVKKPIRAVVNTHWHLDHIGGNALLRREYPDLRVYAAGTLKDALSGFLANYRKQLDDIIPKTEDAKQRAAYEAEVRLIDSGAALAPDVVVTGAETRSIAGRELLIGLESSAVTAGDVWLLDAKTGLLIAGDLVTLPAPFLDTACPTRWASSLDTLARMEFDLLVPGHGAPMTRKQFDVYRGGFRSLLQCAAGKDEKQVCIDGWIATVAPLMPAHDERFTRGLMGYYVDQLRRPPSPLVTCP
jgi:glyoxylase-like metal-dependent hydrolase (beta-lactamase superfamily II)